MPQKMPPGGPYKRKPKRPNQQAAENLLAAGKNTVVKGINKAGHALASPSVQDTKRKVLGPVVKAMTGGRLEEDGSISKKRKKKS